MISFSHKTVNFFLPDLKLPRTICVCVCLIAWAATRMQNFVMKFIDTTCEFCVLESCINTFLHFINWNCNRSSLWSRLKKNIFAHSSPVKMKCTFMHISIPAAIHKMHDKIYRWKAVVSCWTRYSFLRVCAQKLANSNKVVWWKQSIYKCQFVLVSASISMKREGK